MLETTGVTTRKRAKTLLEDKENIATSPYFNKIKPTKKEETNSRKNNTKQELSEMNPNSLNIIKTELKAENNYFKDKFEIKKEKLDEEDDLSETTKKVKWEPPMWREQLARIKEMRIEQNAPVDTMGCDSLANTNPNLSPESKRFCVLVSLMLSSQTKDEVTAKAMSKLEKIPLTVDNILDTNEEKISEAIYPVSFYKVLKNCFKILFKI